MKTIVHCFQFGRIHIIRPNYEWSKEQIILNAINKKIKVTDAYFNYIFADADKFVIENQKFIFGKLAKYKDVENKVVDENSKHIGTKKFDDSLVAESEFIIEPKSGIIAFRPIISKLSAKQFISKFSQLFELSYDNFLISVKIEIINEDYKFFEKIKKLTKIEKVEIDVHPSNPNSRDLWESLDTNLINYRISRLQQIIEGEESGININEFENSEFYKGIVMASDGYGFARIHGKDEKQKNITLRTTDNPVEEKIAKTENPEEIGFLLNKTFKKIISRNPSKKEYES